MYLEYFRNSKQCLKYIGAYLPTVKLNYAVLLDQGVLTRWEEQYRIFLIGWH